ncbi:MAG: transketolase [Desulfatibacillaceae bacterium]
MKQDIDSMCVNTVRALCMDMVQRANSGHPGAPLGMAPAAFALFTKAMRHDPARPDWPDRDRFILSAGHASSLLYAMLHLTGYDVSLADLENFRQWGSRTPGHPEKVFSISTETSESSACSQTMRCKAREFRGVSRTNRTPHRREMKRNAADRVCGQAETPGVETTTGPLGQGIANGVGMAMAERFLAATFNRPGHPVVDHYTWVLCGDGCLMEGVASEAVSLAGHLGLGRLILLYDDNEISIEGSTDITFTEDVPKKFEACGWQVLDVADGNDTAAIATAVEDARLDTERPTLVRIATRIAHGCPNKEGCASSHGAPLGDEEILLAKRNLGCDESAFCIPEQALSAFRECVAKGQQARSQWEELMDAYEKAHPELCRQFRNLMEGGLPEGWDRAIPSFSPGDGPVATRAASGVVLNALAAGLPTLIGGSADLAPSNKTIINDSGDFAKDAWQNRNIRFGVREHAMAAICSGMALHKGVRPYCGTFLVFADYMRPAMRVAALMKAPVTYVLTHDSVAVGEDGPTHQPVEHLSSLRCIPGLTVIRPADAAETAEAWKQAIQTNGPVALILSRQKLPVIDRSRYAQASNLSRGAYVIDDTRSKPDVILVATGSEVSLALTAADILAERGVMARVVNMPSWELFAQQTRVYRDAVLPPDVDKRLVIEAGSPFGWERYAGCKGRILGIDGYGSSAPGNVVLEKYGYTVERVVNEALAMVRK